MLLRAGWQEESDAIYGSFLARLLAVNIPQRARLGFMLDSSKDAGKRSGAEHNNLLRPSPHRPAQAHSLSLTLNSAVNRPVLPVTIIMAFIRGNRLLLCTAMRGFISADPSIVVYCC